MNILGIAGAIGWDANLEKFGNWIHGSGITLVIDGELIFSVSFERFSRTKYDGNFSVEILNSILSRYNLTTTDIDLVALPDYCTVNFDSARYDGSYVKALENIFPKAEIHIVDHHLAHCASSFLTSPFKDDDVNIFSFDNGGAIHYNRGITNADSFYIGNQKNKQLINIAINSASHVSMGALYLSYAGISYYKKTNIKFHDVGSNPKMAEELPGKIMGLSGYGNINNNISPLITTILSTNEYVMPIILPNPEFDEEQQNILNSDTGENIAAFLQHQFENTMLDYFSAIPKSIKKKKLCLGGGCALNILLNTKLIEAGIYEDVHINPAPNDDGLHQGAALLKAWELEKDIKLPTNIGCIGLEYTDSEITNHINSFKLEDYNIRTNSFNEIIDVTAENLKDNKIIGWYQGRSEFGPRALGNRSILANPCYHNKEHLNTKVKKREEWRPYAAVVLEECVDEWFDIPKKDSYYMLFSSMVKPNKREHIPSVTHIDNTCRIQVVNRQQNEKLYLLLKRFYELTGVPILLNTSFNTLKGEPIVETPSDAINSFMNSKIDAVILHNTIIERNDIPNNINIEYT